MTTQEAHTIWMEMNFMERAAIMAQVPSNKSVLKWNRACVEFIRTQTVAA